MSFVTPSPKLVLDRSLYDLRASIGFMRDVTTMVVSQVAFYRNLCPKSEMKEVDIFGRKVHLLKRSSNNRIVKYLLKHLDGAFEMLDQTHLKSLALLIKDHTRTFRLESYSLNYTYDCSSSPAVSYSTSATSDGSSCPIDYIHNSTLDLLLRLQETLDFIVAKSLPEAFVIDFELLFSDNAPADYLPDGYRFQTDEEAEERNLFIETPMKFRSGQIKSDFTSLTFHTRFAKGLLRTDSVDSLLKKKKICN